MTEAQRIAHFSEQVQRALLMPSRGAARRSEYAPQLAYGRHAGPALPDMRRGAVLVLLYPDAVDWNLVLTVRTSHLASHAGQVSFPGGRLEPGETAEQAALREFSEELGVGAAALTLGELPAVNVYASNFLVTPVVAVTTAKPPYRPNSNEVAQVIELSLTQLADRRQRGSHPVVRGGLRFLAPHLRVAGHSVWGATWIILGELLERLESLGLAASP